MGRVLWVLFLILGAIIFYLSYRFKLVQAQLDKTLQLRAEERKGRTRAEFSLRELSGDFEKLKAQSNQNLADGKVNQFLVHFFLTSQICICTPIAILKSCYDLKNGTPRNFGMSLCILIDRCCLRIGCCPSALSMIELNKNIPPNSLDGLELFSHVWCDLFSALFLFSSLGSSLGFMRTQRPVPQRSKVKSRRLDLTVCSVHFFFYFSSLTCRCKDRLVQHEDAT
jgi:hypothetical protein